MESHKIQKMIKKQFWLRLRDEEMPDKMTDIIMRYFLEIFSSGFFKNWFKVEKERRIRKRRSRLEAAVDDAFSLVHRQASSNMAASDVADEVWPTMARSMQKYLRTTRWEFYRLLDVRFLSVMKVVWKP